jgi:hypothetical protein
MTAHSIISLMIIFCTSYILYQQNKWFIRWFPWIARTLSLLSMIPYLIGGLVVVSHFTFEATTDNLIRYGIVYIILCLWLCYQFFHGYNKNKYLSIIMIIMNIILIMWWYLGITLHHYEWDHSFYPYWPAPTPQLYEQTRSIIQWISNILLIWLYIVYAIIYKIQKK